MAAAAADDDDDNDAGDTDDDNAEGDGDEEEWEAERDAFGMRMAQPAGARAHDAPPRAEPQQPLAENAGDGAAAGNDAALRLPMLLQNLMRRLPAPIRGAEPPPGDEQRDADGFSDPDE